MNHNVASNRIDIETLTLSNEDGPNRTSYHSSSIVDEYQSELWSLTMERIWKHSWRRYVALAFYFEAMLLWQQLQGSRSWKRTVSNGQAHQTNEGVRFRSRGEKVESHRSSKFGKVYRNVPRVRMTSCSPVAIKRCSPAGIAFATVDVSAIPDRHASRM